MSDRVLEQLKKARAVGATVWIDNDHIGAYIEEDEACDEHGDYPSILNAEPNEVLETLLTYFGVNYEYV